MGKFLPFQMANTFDMIEKTSSCCVVTPYELTNQYVAFEDTLYGAMQWSMSSSKYVNPISLRTAAYTYM